VFIVCMSAVVSLVANSGAVDCLENSALKFPGMCHYDIIFCSTHFVPGMFGETGLNLWFCPVVVVVVLILL